MKLPTIPLWVKPVVLFATMIGLVWTGYNHGVKYERGRAATEELKLLAVEDRAQKGAAKAIAGMKINHTTNTQVLEREIVNNPLPADCRLSDDGLRILNAIIEGRALPAGGSELPEADPAP